MSRAELLARVRAGEPRIEAARARIDLARAEVRRASRLANPVASYDREAVTIAGDDQVDQFVQLSWSLDVSGRRGRSIAAAEHGEAAARREAAADSLEVLYDGLAIFHEAAYQRLRVAVLEEGRGEIARAVETLRTRQKAGDAAGYDTDRLDLELGAHDDLIAEARIDLATARTQLARVAGEPGGALDASDRLEPAAAPASADLVAEARGRRPDRGALSRRIDEARGQARAARRGWVPGLSLSGGLKSSEVAAERGTGYVVGIAIDLPIFDHGQAEAARALAEERRLSAEARALDRDIDAQVHAGAAALRGRIAQLRAYREGPLARAVDLVKRAESAYREGDRTILDLVDVYRAAREARLRELTLRRDAIAAERALGRALGKQP